MGQLESLSQENNSFYSIASQEAATAIDQLTKPNTSFWLERTPILAELDTLLSVNWRILRPHHRVALEVLRKQIAATDTAGLKIAFRSGYHDFPASE
ncbi:MAG: hypothetical protein HC821_01250 [Lewinella sp.]|nr:hypothetical protein [Lewinella sp.]